MIIIIIIMIIIVIIIIIFKLSSLHLSLSLSFLQACQFHYGLKPSLWDHLKSIKLRNIFQVGELWQDPVSHLK